MADPKSFERNRVHTADFKYLNVPALLERKAWIASESDDSQLVEDASWSKRLSDRLFSLVLFFTNNGLLETEIGNDISGLVLHFNDFTDEGKKFIRSGAPDRWLASFDRDPEKSSEDVSYLTRMLKRARTSTQDGLSRRR